MLKITGTISSEFQDDLHNIFEEAEAQGKGKIVRSIWMKDVEERQSFWKDQNVNRTGKTSNRWSAITYRIALAVFTRSPAAYEALKSYGILQLPSLSAIKQFTSANYQPADLWVMQ